MVTPAYRPPPKQRGLREIATEYVAALKSGDSKEISRLQRQMNQVCFSPAQRKHEIARAAAGDPQLEALLERAKARIRADLEAQQSYLPNRPWSLNEYFMQQHLANRNWWRHLE